MLKELQVKNFAIIDDAELSFSKGLNVLTGETGAGKTLVIEAINLLMGERAESTLIRDGEDRLLVQGYFDFSNNQLVRQYLTETGLAEEGDDADDIVLAREVNRKGKNRAYINGIYVQVSTLRELGSLCIDIHSQHDHQYLLDAKNHLKIIDKFGKEPIRQVKQDYVRVLDQYRDMKEELKKLVRLQGEKEERLNDLRFRAEEIEALNIKDNEEEELENEKRILKNHEKIFQLSSDCINLLKGEDEEQGSLIDRIGEVKKNIIQLSEIDKSFSRYTEDISSITAVLDDLSHYLNSYIADFDYSPQKLDYIQERLYRFEELKKKYGKNLASLKEYALSLREEIDNFTNIDHQIEELKEKLSQKEKEVKARAIDLSNSRKEISEHIELDVVRELKDLSFKNVLFKINHHYLYSDDGIDIGGKKVRLTREGIDDIEFLVSLNIGQDPRPLKKIASGGEVSRIMLALKSIIGSLDFISTMIFDEIDAGIGGATSLVVGQKLFKISKGYQIICITHLAQIAGFADSHYFIEKYTEKERTKIRVGILDSQQRVKELARMLSGMRDSGISVRHAEELLSKCEDLKKGIEGRA